MKPPTVDTSFLYRDSLSLGGCVSIDNSANDNGFLACARTGWPHPGSHGSYSQAAANLRACSPGSGILNTSNLVLVGHGNSGLISTGDGMTPQSSGGWISSGNYVSWQSGFAALRNRGQFFTFCGCDCGADQSGADFVYLMATLINYPVRGRTGLVFLSCPGAYISYENGSVWQVAQPGVHPNPIPKPGHLFNVRKRSLLRIGDVKSVALEQVLSATISFGKGGGRSTKLKGVDAQSLVLLANFASPARIDGSPAALQTGQLEVRFEHNRSEISRRFIIYNDRLLQDIVDKTRYYFCSSSFASSLQHFRSFAL